jgi:hypothetical protein
VSRARSGGVEPVQVLAVAADDSSERSLLAFAASEEHPDDVFIVARNVRFTDQDVALGQDTYCIVTGSSGATHYGGVEAVEWPEPRRLVLTLGRDAAENLLLPRQLELLLPDADSAGLVRERLPLLLG